MLVPCCSRSNFATKTYKHIDEDKIENKLEEDYIVPTAFRFPGSRMQANRFVKEDDCSCVLFHEEYHDPDNPEFRPSWHGTNVWNYMDYLAPPTAKVLNYPLAEGSGYKFCAK